MSVIALVRHGRTAWNLERRLQGHTDNPLVAEGVADARGAAALLRSFDVRGVFASPLVRTQQSAAVIAAELGIAGIRAERADGIPVPGSITGVTVIAELIERDYGLSDGVPVAEAGTRWPGDVASPDAEPITDLGDRAAAAFARLLEERPGALVVAHGALIRAGVARLTAAEVPRIVNGGVVLLSLADPGSPHRFHHRIL